MLIEGDSNEKSLLKANSITTKLMPNTTGDNLINSNYHLQIYNQTINDQKMNSLSQYQLSNNIQQNLQSNLQQNLQQNLQNNLHNQLQNQTRNRLNLNQPNQQHGTIRPHNQLINTTNQLNGGLTPLQNNIISNYATISRAAHLNGSLNGHLLTTTQVPNLSQPHLNLNNQLNHYQQLTPLNTQINEFQLTNRIYGSSHYLQQQQLQPHHFSTVVYSNNNRNCCYRKFNISRVIAFICGLVVLILMGICIGTSDWLTANKYRQGLFQFCVDEGAEMPLPFELNVQPGFCYPNRDQDYIRLTTILCCFGFIFDLLATLMTGFGLCSNSYKKYALYKFALYIMIGSLILILSALVIYPACFASEIETSNRQIWEFGYSYGCGWGSCVFLLGGILLIMCYNDKDDDHLNYYRERTIIHNPGIREVKA